MKLYYLICSLKFGIKLTEYLIQIFANYIGQDIQSPPVSKVKGCVIISGGNS